MAEETRLANTSITEQDPSLTKDVLYERLVHILNANKIDEVAILPFMAEPDMSTCMESDVIQHPYILQQGTKLGIPIFCWVPLLDASYAALKDVKRTETHDNNTEEWWTDPGRRQRVLESTACLMILCPDSFTAINARKRLVQQGYLDPQEECQLLDMVLTFPRNCKSSGVWHHRKWLICHMYKDYETSPLPPSFVKKHLQACHLAAQRYPKCYYAWTMRHWLVEHLGRQWWRASLEGVESVQEDQLSPLEEEYEQMKTHMDRNVSDHSTHQHLQQCLIQLSGRWIMQQLESKGQVSSSGSSANSGTILSWTRSELALRRQRRENWCQTLEARTSGRGHMSRSAILKVLVDESAEYKRASFEWVVRMWVHEMHRVKDMIQSYPGHESLWNHLRFVYYGLCWLDCETDIAEHEVSVPENDQSKAELLFTSPAVESGHVRGLSPHQSASGTDAGNEKQKELQDQYLTWVRRLDIMGHSAFTE
ncbi:Protein prenyltransferase alpha subunit repeat-containing protein 1 [Mortierella polycephala]|uniref:Protein prenyltransferase alpha subunit repeat-containing protein 1 n=1 Tax=Mortierella polycephala TaxID=41804 RepID=A0A9P6TWV5_9FUNG|nr:Protein prenyltransferase alpha subunit repeat-containing protein 1 [Mortierella polycephala]